MKRILDYFLELVQIDSESGHEDKMAQYLISWLKKNKFQYKKDRAGNIYAKRGNKDDPILFCAHMDTVSPGKGIKAKVVGDYVTSSGDTILGADNKAFIAPLLASLENNISDKPIELVFSTCEETTSGIQSMPSDWISSKLGFIFDSAKPLGGIILRSPYIYNIYTTFTGKAAHASTPAKGKNAFLPMIDALSKIAVGELDHKETTINFGLISGGTGTNTIPPSITVQGEVRSYNKKFFAQRLKNIESIFIKAAKKYSTSYKFWKDGFSPGYVHDKADKIIKKISEIYKKNNIATKLYPYSGVSDANYLNSIGIKTINLTDGVIDPHTVNEKISVNDLVRLKKIISAIISSENL